MNESARAVSDRHHCIQIGFRSKDRLRGPLEAWVVCRIRTLDNYASSSLIHILRESIAYWCDIRAKTPDVHPVVDGLREWA